MPEIICGRKLGGRIAALDFINRYALSFLGDPKLLSFVIDCAEVGHVNAELIATAPPAGVALQARACSGESSPP
jgi:hypothetical protein